MSDDRIPPTSAEQTTDHTDGFVTVKKSSSVGYSIGLMLPEVENALEQWQAKLERVHRTGKLSVSDSASLREAREHVDQAIYQAVLAAMGRSLIPFDVATDGVRYRGLKNFCEAQFSASITLNGHRPSYAEPNALGPIELHWYPDTGLGYRQVFAENLDALADYVIAHQRAMEGWEEHER